MIFKTITDETTLSGQRIVGALQARKIAQQQATAQLEIDIACLKEYQVACQNGTVTTEQFDTIMHKASASALEYSAKVKAGTGTAQSYANTQRATNSALQEVSIGAGIASKAVKLFSTALNMIAFTAIIQGISWLIGKVDEWIVTAKEAKESADAFKQSLSTFFNETQTNLKTISSLSDRFNELSKNVDDNGKKVGGTEEEYAEFLDICQQVGQIMPELITGYTNEGEAIITLQGKVDSLTDSYKEAIKAKAALFISKGDEEGNTIDNFFEDYDNFINGYKGLWDLKTSPSGQNSLEDFEEYYGYDKIHEWLSKVKDASLNELNNLEGELATAQRGYMYIAKILDDSDFDITNITEENYNAIHDVLNNRFTVMEKELSDRVINIRSAFQNMLYADSDYWNIDDENVLSAINSLYGSIDAEFIKNNELFSQKALQTFESDFVSLFNNDATKQAMVDFYTPIADDETVKDYADRIKSSLETVQSYCNENGITVPINFTDSEQTIDDLEAQYQCAVDFAKDKFGESIEIETQFLNEAKENLENEYKKVSEWGFDNDYIEWLKNDTIRTVFGNVDMDKRTIITWSDELRQTYADALASWDYDPEIGGIDTVFGGSSRFGENINGTGWEVAFTPILPDGTFLNSDTVYTYIESIVAEAYNQNGEVTQNNLKAIDAQGQQIGDTFVHGIFAAVDDSLNYDNNGNLAETVGRLMHFTGDFGAIKLAKQEIEDARKVINWDSWFSENVKTPEEIEIFQEIIQNANSAADAIEKYKTAISGISNENPTSLGYVSPLTNKFENIKSKTITFLEMCLI